MAAARPRQLVCDAGSLSGSDLLAVADLARLHVAARRLDLQLVLRNASTDLVELIAFVGLSDVLRLEFEGQSKEWEQRLGVEEERQLGDLPG
jgi:hypothetical protein